MRRSGDGGITKERNARLGRGAEDRTGLTRSAGRLAVRVVSNAARFNVRVPALFPSFVERRQRNSQLRHHRQRGEEGVAELPEPADGGGDEHLLTIRMRTLGCYLVVSSSVPGLFGRTMLGGRAAHQGTVRA